MVGRSGSWTSTPDERERGVGGAPRSEVTRLLYHPSHDRLRADAVQTKKRFRSMKTKKDDYIAVWGREQGHVSDPDLRQRFRDC